MTGAREVFARIDRLDADVIAGMMAEDATMVFGNHDPLLGREAILAGNLTMLAHLKAMRHNVRQKWTVDDTTIAVTDVSYNPRRRQTADAAGGGDLAGRRRGPDRRVPRLLRPDAALRPVAASRPSSQTRWAEPRC